VLLHLFYIYVVQSGAIDGSRSNIAEMIRGLMYLKKEKKKNHYYSLYIM